MPALMLNVTGTLPSFFRYIVAVDVPPALNVPQLTLESADVHPLSEYTPSCTDGGATTVMLPVLETVRVATNEPTALVTRAITANTRTVPMVAFCIAIIFH